MSLSDNRGTFRDGYDHPAEWHQGYEDAKNGFFRRLHQTAPYRAGYDKGLGDSLGRALVHSVNASLAR